MAPAPAKASDAVPVVIDSDLAPDDLAAITYLVRHPRVRVLGITVPSTGMVTCDGGLQLLADLFAAIETPSVPVACGVEPRGRDAVAVPGGLVRRGGDRQRAAAPRSVALRPRARGRRRTSWPGRQDRARPARRRPRHRSPSWPPSAATTRRRTRRIAGITSMAGIVDADSHDAGQGVGEWNAAADPAAFDAVLAGPVPVTVVPDDPVPAGPPRGMDAPVVGGLGVGTVIESPAYWDLATAGIFTTPGRRDRPTRTAPGGPTSPATGVGCTAPAPGTSGWSPGWTRPRSTTPTRAVFEPVT